MIKCCNSGCFLFRMFGETLRVPFIALRCPTAGMMNLHDGAVLNVCFLCVLTTHFWETGTNYLKTSWFFANFPHILHRTSGASIHFYAMLPSPCVIRNFYLPKDGPALRRRRNADPSELCGTDALFDHFHRLNGKETQQKLPKSQIFEITLW